MRNTLHPRFLIKTWFLHNSIFWFSNGVQLNAQFVLFHFWKICVVYFGSTTTIKIFASRHILLKQTNWKLNWLIKNPLKKFQYFSALQIIFSNITKVFANRRSYIVFFQSIYTDLQPVNCIYISLVWISMQ